MGSNLSLTRENLIIPSKKWFSESTVVFKPRMLIKAAEAWYVSCECAQVNESGYSFDLWGSCLVWKKPVSILGDFGIRNHIRPRYRFGRSNEPGDSGADMLITGLLVHYPFSPDCFGLFPSLLTSVVLIPITLQRKINAQDFHDPVLYISSVSYYEDHFPLFLIYLSFE